MKASDTPMVAHSLYHAVQNHRIPAWSITPLMVEESRRLGKVIIQDSNDTYYHRVGEMLEHNKIHPSNFKKKSNIDKIHSPKGKLICPSFDVRPNDCSWRLEAAALFFLFWPQHCFFVSLQSFVFVFVGAFCPFFLSLIPCKIPANVQVRSE